MKGLKKLEGPVTYSGDTSAHSEALLHFLDAQGWEIGILLYTQEVWMSGKIYQRIFLS